jgi:DNA-binding HxlR family transcriptional regulator
MERKLNRLENEIDGIQRKALTSRLQKTHATKKSRSGK